jgi:glycosyltransferase involved in cell wall biosynthesis
MNSGHDQLGMAAPSISARISVVLPNYNHVRYLEGAVHALLNQNPPPHELILIDDASTDGSIELIHALSERYKQIRAVYNAENIGVSSNLQLGLEQSTGDYVYFAAADDFVLPDFFSTVLSVLTSYPEAGLGCADAAIFNGISDEFLGIRPAVSPLYRPGYVSPTQTLRLLQRGDNWIFTGAALFRRNALVAAGGLEASLDAFADGFAARKIALVNGFCYVPELVLCSRFFRKGVSGSVATNLERAKEVDTLIYHRLLSDNSFPRWYAESFRKRWRFSSCRLAVKARPIDFEFVSEIGVRSNADAIFLRLLALLCPQWLARFLILARLWLIWRPYRLTDLIGTSLFRAFRGRLKAAVLPPRDGSISEAATSAGQNK